MNCKETNKFEEFVNYKNSQNEYKNNLENTQRIIGEIFME